MPKLMVIALGLLLPAVLNAAPADPVTPAPIIFLSDNLDEPDGLGFCLDTQGRGRSDFAHAHSCKPNGGDVQFRFDNQNRIQSVAYPDLCLELDGGEFRLNTCSEALSQMFLYSTDTRELHPGEDQDVCITVGSTTQSAGPFVSRKLELTDCESAPIELKTWSVRP